MSDDTMDLDAELKRERELEQGVSTRAKSKSPPHKRQQPQGEPQKEQKKPAAAAAGAFGQMMAASRKNQKEAVSPPPAQPEDDDDPDRMDEDEPGAAFKVTTTSSSKDKGKGKAVASTSGSTNGSTSVNRETLPWVEKYRPQRMEDIVSQGDIVTVLERFIKTNSLPHLLFHGPAGTGKTSLILTVARQLYGPKYNSMILELNASDDRGIDVVRNEIKEFASTRTIFSAAFKLVILDEADAMTSAAQAALRRIIEKYTKNVRFCLIGNYVSKIIPALQSRCTRFRFAPLDSQQVKVRLMEVVAAENVKIDEGGVTALLRLSAGDMRKTLNILQATAAAFGAVTEEAVHLTTGSPLPADIERVLTWLLNEDYPTAYARIQRIKTEKGLALLDIISEIHHYLVLLEIPQPVKIYLAECLSQIEYDLTAGCAEKIQLGSLVGAFQIAKDSLVTLAK